MLRDLFTEHGLHGLHEWPEAQDAGLALLEARQKATLVASTKAGGMITPPEIGESRSESDFQ